MKAAAVLYVRHLDPMSSFYRECFGLEIAGTAEDYCVLESDAWSLSLVTVPDAMAAILQDPVTPPRRDGTPVKLAFHLPSIEDLRAVMSRLGGQVDPGETQWEFRGLRHSIASIPRATSCTSRSPWLNRPGPRTYVADRRQQVSADGLIWVPAGG